MILESTHPLRMKQSINERATSIKKKCLVPKAKMEAHSNSFSSKLFTTLSKRLIEPIKSKIVSTKGVQQHAFRF